MTTTTKKTSPKIRRKASDIEGRVQPIDDVGPCLGALVLRRLDQAHQRVLRELLHGNLYTSAVRLPATHLDDPSAARRLLIEGDASPPRPADGRTSQRDPCRG